ncbi:hypothetical protein [Aestuariivirga sp.]|jgi:hypothetical protein|uniref:hypothetical protein n=1 Tax=Aestuariivirga sp. TaxID=2650926 RepID=UPI0037838553
MRHAFATIILFSCATSASAMNWEGHDDWMQDLSYAQVYQHALPHAVPLPIQDCSENTTAKSDNPYEQIPLTPDRCHSAREGHHHSR